MRVLDLSCGRAFLSIFLPAPRIWSPGLGHRPMVQCLGKYCTNPACTSQRRPLVHPHPIYRASTRKEKRYDRERAATKQGANCKTISDTTSGGTRTKETECRAADSVIKTKFTLTVASDTPAHTETVTSFDPPSTGRTGSTPLTAAVLPDCATYTIAFDTLCVFHHKSTTTSRVGCEQQTRRLPSAGLSSG